MQVRDFDLHFSFSGPGFVSHVDHWIPGNATDAKTSLLVRRKKAAYTQCQQTSHNGRPKLSDCSLGSSPASHFLPTGPQAAQNRQPQCLTASLVETLSLSPLPSPPTENSHLDMASTCKLHHQFIGYWEGKKIIQERKVRPQLIGYDKRQEQGATDP